MFKNMNNFKKIELNNKELQDKIKNLEVQNKKLEYFNKKLKYRNNLIELTIEENLKIEKLELSLKKIRSAKVFKLWRLYCKISGK